MSPSRPEKPRPASRPKPLSGGARIKQAGKIPFLLALTPEQREILGEAAEIDGRSVTQFLIFHGVATAKRISRKNP